MKPCDRKAKLVQKQLLLPALSPGHVPGGQEGFAATASRDGSPPSTSSQNCTALFLAALLGAFCSKLEAAPVVTPEATAQLGGTRPGCSANVPSHPRGSCHRPLLCSSMKSAGPALLFSADYLYPEREMRTSRAAEPAPVSGGYF